MIRDLQSIFYRALNEISNVSMAALVAGHEMLGGDEKKPDPELEAIRMEGRRRFIGVDGSGGNQALMRSLPHVKTLHPDLKIESSGYNMFFIDHPDPPWMKPDYKRVVLGRLRGVISAIEDPDRRAEAMNAFSYYVGLVAPEDTAASDIFCLDLVMETGVAFAPAERFYKLGTAPRRIAFRPVMVAEPAEFAEDARLVSEFLSRKLG